MGKRIVFVFCSPKISNEMAASWLRINELSNSYAHLVCTVGQIQSINLSQKTLILCDNDRTSTITISFDDVHQSINSSLSGQFVQVYGKLIRQTNDKIQINAQFIRLLGTDFDLNEYIEGLTSMRNYMNYVNNRGNPIRNIL